MMLHVLLTQVRPLQGPCEWWSLCIDCRQVCVILGRSKNSVRFLNHLIENEPEVLR